MLMSNRRFLSHLISRKSSKLHHYRFLKSLSGNMGSDGFSTRSAGKGTNEDGSLNICTKYHAITK